MWFTVTQVDYCGLCVSACNINKSLQIPADKVSQNQYSYLIWNAANPHWGLGERSEFSQCSPQASWLVWEEIPPLSLAPSPRHLDPCATSARCPPHFFRAGDAPGTRNGVSDALEMRAEYEHEVLNEPNSALHYSFNDLHHILAKLYIAWPMSRG